MRCAFCVLACAMVLWLASPSVAGAQERAGFWGGFGGGWGSANVTADDLEGDREGSGVGYFNLGWTASDQLLVGAEFILWSKTFAIEPDIDRAGHRATARAVG